MTDVTNSKILVLGGSGVLGGCIAAELHARGSRVMLAARDAGRLQEAATRVGPDVPSVVFDLHQPHHAEHVVETAVRSLGGLDGLVNAAGVVAFGGVGDLADSTLDELAGANFLGPMRVARAAIPHLESGGFILNITGVVAEQPVAGMAAYSGVKSALSAATRAMGRELRRAGITTIDARPPHTETGLAGRPIAGEAPAMPEGLAPESVARTIVDGIAAGSREIPSSAFGSG